MFSSHERLLGPRIRTWCTRDHGLSMRYGDSQFAFFDELCYSGGISLFSLRLGGLTFYRVPSTSILVCMRQALI
jgi:hypothetical protein